MTVVDFRSSGGFDGSQPHGLSHDYSHADGQQGHSGDWQDQDWQESGWDDQPYRSDAGSLVDSPSLLGRVTRLTHYLGALVSVGLIVILAVWGYKLVIRDVSGVPVIRAVEGEARTAPDNPGGELTHRTGLAVNSVAAGATRSRWTAWPSRRRPAGLEPQDVAMGEFGATAQEPSHPVELPLLEETARVIARPDGRGPDRGRSRGAIRRPRGDLGRPCGRGPGQRGRDRPGRQPDPRHRHHHGIGRGRGRRPPPSRNPRARRRGRAAWPPRRRSQAMPRPGRPLRPRNPPRCRAASPSPKPGPGRARRAAGADRRL
ncbi:hypothetical protein [Paracoccus thiocyanatus]|uniref:hypothetical protein n=1 Tax=Paracoccus thiocyanatus TaxID=34006 RepID=UPI00216289DA|nr:hypothetical protein [Paracoccus thiocyanatus]